MALSSALIETLRLDYGFKKLKAWVLSVFVPLALFLFGVRNFIEVISVAGSVAIGIEGVILVSMYKKAKRLGDRESEYSLGLPNWVLNGMIFLLVIGAAYALFIE